jgi:hypothetical protein
MSESCWAVNSVRSAFDIRIWAPKPRALVEAESNSANTAGGATHIRGIPALGRFEAPSTYTNSLRRHVHPPGHAPLLPPQTSADQLHCGARTPFLSCCAEQRPRLAEQERDTFYHHHGTARA